MSKICSRNKKTDSLKQKEVTRDCPVCLSNTAEVLHHQRFVLPEKYCLPDNYDLVSCLKCGFVYADTSATQKDYDYYYSELSKYEDEAVASGTGAADWDIVRLEDTVSDIKKVITDKSISILDIGCANGGLLAALKRKGFSNLTGLDPSKACVSFVKRKIGIAAYDGGLFNLEALSGKKFDLIVLTHVFEHVLDVKKALKNVVAHLNDGGLLYLEVPNAGCYSDYFVVLYYYFDCEHINHFDKSSLGNLTSQQGLECLLAEEKEILISEKKYPALYGFYRKKGHEPVRNIQPDFSAKRSVLNYINVSAKINTWPKLEDIAAANKPVIVWGAGSFTHRLLANTALGDCKISLFIDNDSNKQGKELKAIPIKAPDAIDDPTMPIIICSALHSSEIQSQIDQLGLANEVIILD